MLGQRRLTDDNIRLRCRLLYDLQVVELAVHDVDIRIGLGDLVALLHIANKRCDFNLRDGFGDAVQNLAADVACGSCAGRVSAPLVSQCSLRPRFGDVHEQSRHGESAIRMFSELSGLFVYLQLFECRSAIDIGPQF